MIHFVLASGDFAGAKAHRLSRFAGVKSAYGGSGSTATGVWDSHTAPPTPFDVLEGLKLRPA